MLTSTNKQCFSTSDILELDINYDCPDARECGCIVDAAKKHYAPSSPFSTTRST